ncbi:alpha-L-fucosidase [Clostridium sp.]|uniref:alpha-L-fucosidase n=1 Tax=Clostridium sp. TaxID=1506 RepID=UPI00284D502C|nr:alpha-L-fucosidase [Clostridium sp.]MDR3593715.1 alpha-L-fucosidase [Clostridium sp.]
MYNKKNYLKIIDQVIDAGPFHDNWDSLGEYQAPKWYGDSKFGIFIHWGVYSVPEFGSEWYSRNMYIQESNEFEHHRKTYGEHKDFGYKDFIPMFRAEKFNADEWADLFKNAGAQYVIPVAEHHDGFQMYKSEISHWNSYEMGPRKDVLGELSQAFQERGMTNGASSHRVEHWFFMGHGRQFESDITNEEKEGDFYWPAMEEKDHHDLFSEPTPTKEFLEDWLVRCCEIVDKFKPKVMYFDWWIQHSSLKPYLKKFAAYYYNRAKEWGLEGVVINYKHDAFMFGTAVIDVERGQFADIKPFIWQTDTAVAKNSWCYTKNNDYKKAKDIICDLVDIVSKNGRLLLNVGPKADGSIPEEDKNILLEIGEWLKVNGEAIYGAGIYRVPGEGPTKIVEGQFCDATDKVFTSKDIRYTTKGSYLYATVLNYPEDGCVNLVELAEQDASSLPKFHGIVKEVSVLGFEEVIQWTRTKNGLQIKTNKVKSEKPVVIKILID